MPDLLTTDEAATYLRLSERKLYELVSHGAVPCTKVTGKWLFPKAALDRWLAAGLIAPSVLAHVAAPLIVGGSHDPLLEWALRESACGLAYLPEGSEAGLRRLARRGRDRVRAPGAGVGGGGGQSDAAHRHRQRRRQARAAGVAAAGGGRAAFAARAYRPRRAL